MNDLDELYRKRLPALKRARQQLRKILKEVVGRIEDKDLVRAAYDTDRTKGLGSLKRKAESHGWTSAEAMMSCNDLVGARVVCNNIEDVHRFAALVQEVLPSDLGQIEVIDHIKNPSAQGYRALHLNFRLNVAEEIIAFDLVPCEIQIRSRLQDAWAELAHTDIYKQEGLSDDLRGQMAQLARMLSAADDIASEIRARVQQVVKPPTQRPDLRRVTPAGLAFVFKEVFGRAPPDYAVAQAINICGELGIRSLNGLPPVLQRTDFREALDRTYRKAMPIGIDPELALRASLHALAKGDRSAVEYVRREAQEQFDEADRYARSEMLSDLPDSVDDLIQELKDPRGDTDDVEHWAQALGAANRCASCGATVVNAFSFAEAAVDHYEASEDDADDVFREIETALYRSGIDTGRDGYPGHCTHCAGGFSRED